MRIHGLEHVHSCERCDANFSCHGTLDLGSDLVATCEDDHAICDVCREDLRAEAPRHRLTRHERLQGLADRGHDTWEEVRGER